MNNVGKIFRDYDLRWKFCTVFGNKQIPWKMTNSMINSAIMEFWEPYIWVLWPVAVEYFTFLLRSMIALLLLFLLTIPAASCRASTNQHGETQSGWRFVEPARLLIQYDWRWSLTVDQLLSGTVIMCSFCGSMNRLSNTTNNSKRKTVKKHRTFSIYCKLQQLSNRDW